MSTSGAVVNDAAARFPRRRARRPARSSFPITRAPSSSSSESPSPRLDGAAENAERPASEPSDAYPPEPAGAGVAGVAGGAPRIAAASRAPNLDAPGAPAPSSVASPPPRTAAPAASAASRLDLRPRTPSLGGVFGSFQTLGAFQPLA